MQGHMNGGSHIIDPFGFQPGTKNHYGKNGMGGGYHPSPFVNEG